MRYLIEFKLINLWNKRFVSWKKILEYFGITTWYRVIYSWMAMIIFYFSVKSNNGEILQRSFLDRSDLLILKSESGFDFYGSWLSHSIPMFCLMRVIAPYWTMGITSSVWLSRKNLSLTLLSGPDPPLLSLSALIINELFWYSWATDTTLLTRVILAALAWLLNITSVLPSLSPRALPVAWSMLRVPESPELHLGPEGIDPLYDTSDPYLIDEVFDWI